MEANISEIGNGTNMWVGGDLSPIPEEAIEQIDDIIGKGIKYIVDMRVETHDYDVWANYPDIQYHNIPTDDANGYSMPNEAFDRIATIDRLAQSEREGILFHCHMGINRGPTAAFAMLLRRGVHHRLALWEIRKARPIAAIGYAPDAYRWHLGRTMVAGDVIPIEAKARLADFTKDWEQMLTSEDVARIDAHITASHEEYGRKWREAIAAHVEAESEREPEDA